MPTLCILTLALTLTLILTDQVRRPVDAEASARNDFLYEQPVLHSVCLAYAYTTHPRLPEWQPSASSSNRYAKAARAEFLALVDADDYPPPDLPLGAPSRPLPLSYPSPTPRKVHSARPTLSARSRKAARRARRPPIILRPRPLMPTRLLSDRRGPVARAVPIAFYLRGREWGRRREWGRCLPSRNDGRHLTTAMAPCRHGASASAAQSVRRSIPSPYPGASSPASAAQPLETDRHPEPHAAGGGPPVRAAAAVRA